MIKFNELPVFELQVPDEDSGVFAISLVDRPATETEWLAFSEDKKVDEVKFSLNSDKQILTAPLMLADTPIYRKDSVNGEHYIVFSEATLEKMSINFFKNNVRDFNEMHDSSFGIDNATVIESWIKTSENDKSTDLGFGDAPVGSWFISVFIDDKEFWEDNIKTGKFKGFSLEGLFEKVQLSSDEPEKPEKPYKGATVWRNEEADELDDFINKLAEAASADNKADILAGLKKLL
jgi:hypothetical protein